MSAIGVVGLVLNLHAYDSVFQESFSLSGSKLRKMVGTTNIQLEEGKSTDRGHFCLWIPNQRQHCTLSDSVSNNLSVYMIINALLSFFHP